MATIGGWKWLVEINGAASGAAKCDGQGIATMGLRCAEAWAATMEKGGGVRRRSG